MALLRRSWRLYRSAYTDVGVPREGGVIRVPLVSGTGLSNLTFWRNEKFPQNKENWIQGLMAHALERGRGAVVDVGVNVGKILLNLIDIDRTVPYVGFDPNLLCCNYAEAIIRANDLRHHSILPIGLFDRAQIAGSGSPRTSTCARAWCRDSASRTAASAKSPLCSGAATTCWT